MGKFLICLLNLTYSFFTYKIDVNINATGADIVSSEVIKAEMDVVKRKLIKK